MTRFARTVQFIRSRTRQTSLSIASNSIRYADGEKGTVSASIGRSLNDNGTEGARIDPCLLF